MKTEIKSWCYQIEGAEVSHASDCQGSCQFSVENKAFATSITQDKTPKSIARRRKEIPNSIVQMFVD